MKTIAFDTSLSRGSVAARDGDRLAIRWLEPAGEHARLLAAAIAAATGELGWQPADAGLVAVVHGPGSFTGLRVGVTTAKALAWATGCRLLGISGCEAAAWSTAAALGLGNAGTAAPPIHVAYDAGRGELYTAVATPAVESPTGWSVGTGTIAAASEWVLGLPPGAIVAGPAVGLLAESLTHRPDLVVAPVDARVAGAAEVADIALVRAAFGEAHDPAGLVPEYMRQTYAHEAAGR